MNPDELFRRYQELQRYVGWTEEDACRVRSVADLLRPHLGPLIDDFYAEIERHPEAAKVITGGPAQVQRLKGTLLTWLNELLAGCYDRAYVARRWRVGWRHVEIGLDQVYANVALSRLRRGLLRSLRQRWPGEAQVELDVRASLNTLIDLDLAIIEDAYQAEYHARQQRSEKQRSEAAFRTLVEAAPCMILILRPDHAVAYFSPFAEEVTGYAAAGVLGHDFVRALVPAEGGPAVSAELGRALADVPVREFESRVVCRDGTERWATWNVRRLDDYEGGPAVLAVGQDITKLKEVQEQALRAERLAAIGQMMTGLAHESGNALARSQACLEMLELEVPDRPDALDLIARIRKAQDHLKQLYEEVRGYAAPLRLDRTPCSLAGVWRQAWENLALARQGRDAALREETAGLDLHAVIDPFRLEQVFRNAFENSLAACPDPVRVTVRCWQADLGGRPALGVAVRDNGPGLTPEQRQRIFEPFYTTKTKGTGLGMAIAKRIIEAHGGRIAAPPCPGPGAEISITLPREIP
jgi:two-component system, LuxR family, sensor kinase FixL